MSSKLVSALGLALVLAVSTATGASAATSKPIHSGAAMENGSGPAVSAAEQRANERVGPANGGEN